MIFSLRNQNEIYYLFSFIFKVILCHQFVMEIKLIKALLCHQLCEQGETYATWQNFPQSCFFITSRV